MTEEPPPRAAIYLLMTGLNDARLHGASPVAAQEYAASISRILRAFHEANPDALTIVVEQPHLIDYSLYPPHNRGSDPAVDLYNEILKRAAEADPNTLYVRTPAWNAPTMLSPDTVHPNNSGHIYLAHEVVTAAMNSSSSSTTSNAAPIGGNHAEHR